MLVVATSAGDIAYYGLAVFLVLVGVGSFWMLWKLGNVFGRLSSFISGTERDLLPVVVKTGGTVDRINKQLDKADTITDSAVSMAESADTAVRAISFAIAKPVEKVSGAAAGVSHAFSSFRKNRDFRCRDGRRERGGRPARARSSRGSDRGGRGTPPRAAPSSIPAQRVRRYDRGMRTTAELREGFLSFFEEKGHLRRPSASLVPRADDHSTLLTTGGHAAADAVLPRAAKQPPAPLTTTVQKVFRTPDIDEVGLDTRHLTFFEMLGNFSFGHYFKDGAIDFATSSSSERMSSTGTGSGSACSPAIPSSGSEPTRSPIDLWTQIGHAARADRRRCRRPRTSGPVGGPGPCGPDSEIYYDWGDEHGLRHRRLPAGLLALRALPRVLEPGLHGVRAARGRDADAAAEAEHRHRAWGSSGRPASSRRSTSIYDTDGFQLIMDWIERESGVALRRLAARRRRRTASWPTTAAG